MNMNKTIDDLENRWLKRRPDGLSQLESRVLTAWLIARHIAKWERGREQ